ncbi:TetR/AcrR family transcriptional regulator [Yinghuangia sp. ASG 101]|uniref:TetR/AcrR family transcriptional regulator n=1 Tax=Yinghuangia sp. ASG 101 TaxID=2896848 RepID=UPI001E4E106D|nr:TetR/AcrR family transcriptional regulator [Yinghuangia sp. ASG 101]UGQ11769.1 TetR/AcrR family transcriptional regulator [Yinghuangia sp. ASG 101]
MAQTPARERDPLAKRARIADAAFELFGSQGFAETTIDQIAAAARVGRRTVFHHFPSKEAVLFDHLVVRRDAAIRRLRERPSDEPPLISLHALFRESAERGYEDHLVARIRAVVATEPRLAHEQFSLGTREFEQSIVAVLKERPGPVHSALELHALTRMALGWFATAALVYFAEERPSLVGCFDEVVATCTRADAFLSASLGSGGQP